MRIIYVDCYFVCKYLISAGSAAVDLIKTSFSLCSEVDTVLDASDLRIVQSNI